MERLKTETLENSSKEVPMNKLVRWQPMNDLVSLREAMDRLFEDSWVTPRTWTAMSNWTEPTLDIYETRDHVVVRAAIPGYKPEEVEITVTGNVLSLQGQTREETEDKDKNYLRRETRLGSFTRTIELPSGLQSDKADAKFENGMLTISLPKAEEVKPKSIKVRAQSVGNGNQK
jgi:HSP20 family protein